MDTAFGEGGSPAEAVLVAGPRLAQGWTLMESVERRFRTQVKVLGSITAGPDPLDQIS